MKRLLFLVLLLPCTILAQSVVYDVEPQIVQTQSKYSEAWRKMGKLKFYVIQVSSFTGDHAAERAQEMVANLNVLLESMPSAKAYSTFEEPNFRVRIGSFLSRTEANRALVLVEEQYPGVFVTTEVRNISNVVEE